MSGELTYSSAAGLGPPPSSSSASPPDVTSGTSSSQSTDATKPSNKLNRPTATPEINHKQARQSQMKSKRILSDGDLNSIVAMIGKLEPFPAAGGQSNSATDATDITRTTPPPVEPGCTLTLNQEGKPARDAEGSEDLEEDSTLTNNPQHDTPLPAPSTSEGPGLHGDTTQIDFSKSIDFAQSQRADLIITIGGITAQVVSSVVCHFSPLFRYMCTPGATKPVGLVPGLEWEKYEYLPPRGDISKPGILNLPVLCINSGECWAKDKGETITITLHAMHGNSAELPLELLDLPLIGRVAEFAWAYSCQQVMVPWFRIWLDHPVPINQRLLDQARNCESLELFSRSLGGLTVVAIVMRDAPAVKFLWAILLLLIPGDAYGVFVSQLIGCPTRILKELEGNYKLPFILMTVIFRTFSDVAKR